MGNLISRTDLKNLIDSGKLLTIVEALPKQYYEAAHLPGAINIPHDEVQATAALLIPNKDGSVIVYCANTECQNSHIAAETLRKMGYSNVYEFTEGKKGWMEAGLPLETGLPLKESSGSSSNHV